LGVLQHEVRHEPQTNHKIHVLSLMSGSKVTHPIS
jgi:hypothetical protein